MSQNRHYASVLRLQHVCNVHLSCRFTLQKCYKHVLNASAFNTSCNVSVTRCLRRKNAIMHPFYVFNTPWNVPVSRRFTSEIRPKFARFAPQMHVLRFEQVCNAHLSCRFTLQKCYKRVLNASVFNTSCNVSVTRRLRRKNAIMHPFYVINTNTPWNVPVSRRFKSQKYLRNVLKKCS